MLEKIMENWRIGTGKREWRGRTVLGNDDSGVICINLMLRRWRIDKSDTFAVGEPNFVKPCARDHVSVPTAKQTR
jgi:hypothetical protein